MYTASDIARARAALYSVPPDLPYDEWFKVGCSAIAAGLSTDDIDAWSSGGSNYKGPQDVEKTFRNVTRDGRITSATLFHMARQYNHQESRGQVFERSLPAPKNHHLPKNLSILSFSEVLAEITGNCVPATASHPYIQKKLGLPDGLLVYKGTKTIAGHDCNGALVLPLSDLNSNPVGVQFIPLKGEKVFPPGTKLSSEACLSIGGKLSESGTVYIVEGIGQAWSAHQATTSPAVVSFGKGMAGVAKAINAKHPDLRLVIVPDAKGESQAAEIALDVEGLYVELPEDWPANYDINDFHKKTGSLKAVAELLQTAKPPSVANRNILSPDRSNTLNDSGNATRLTKHFGRDIRWLPSMKKWMTWNGQNWALDEDGTIDRLARNTAQSIYLEARNETDADKARSISKWAGTSLSHPRLKAMIELAKSELNISIPMSALDQKDMLLGTPSGVVDLKTGMLVKTNRGDYITRTASAPYVASATCPTWEKFLDRCFSGNRSVIEFIQRAVGYCLTGKTNEHAMFFIYGTGCNGKSVFLKTLRAMLGDYAMQAQAEMLMQSKGERASNDIARLRGARMVSAIEIESGRRLSAALVKQLTGGDQIAVRFLYGEYFEYKPTFKIWLAANHKPIIPGDDYATCRRICLIPFLVTIPEQELDKQLASKLAAEAPGILQWAIQGCLEWQRIGLNLPPEVREATNQYKFEMNVFDRWLDECCETGKGKWVRAGKAFESHCNWAEQNGLPPLSNADFADKLLEHGFTRKKESIGKIYLGLALL